VPPTSYTTWFLGVLVPGDSLSVDYKDPVCPSTVSLSVDRQPTHSSARRPSVLPSTTWDDLLILSVVRTQKDLWR